MNREQLLDIAHAAIDRAESPEDLAALMAEAQIEVSFHHHKNKDDGFIDGWTLRLPGSKTWIRGSEVESDRFETLGWLRIAKTKGWPMSWHELVKAQDAQRAPAESPAPQSTDRPQLTDRPSAPERREETEEEELQRLIDNLLALIHNMIAAVQNLVVELINSILRSCHVEHQIRVMDYEEQSGPPGTAPVPASIVSKEPGDTKAAAKALKQMVEALQQNKASLLPKAPAGDADAAADRAELAVVLTKQRLAQLNEGRGENPYVEGEDDGYQEEEEEPEFERERMG